MSLSSLLIVQIPCFLILLARTEIDWNLLVVFIVLIGNLAGDLQRFLFYLTELDTSYVDLNRCYFFDEVPVEKGVVLDPAEVKAFTTGNLNKVKQLESSLPVKPAFESLESMDAEHLSAEYVQGQPILKSVDFKLQTGWTVGVIGPSGSGKSSLLKLLWRYFDASEGKLSINGRDLTSVEARSLRRSLSVVTQESPLLMGNVRQNIDPRGEHKDEEILGVMEALGISKEGFGLDTEIDQDGRGISTGQRQLISLARGLLQPCPLVVLDEATASLDHQLELQVRSLVMSRRKAGSLVVVVAHRIDSVRDCDWILAFSEGRLLEQGTPGDLLAKPDSYFRKMQLQ